MKTFLTHSFISLFVFLAAGCGKDHKNNNSNGGTDNSKPTPSSSPQSPNNSSTNPSTPTNPGEVGTTTPVTDDHHFNEQDIYRFSETVNGYQSSSMFITLKNSLSDDIKLQRLEVKTASSSWRSLEKREYAELASGILTTEAIDRLTFSQTPSTNKIMQAAYKKNRLGYFYIFVSNPDRFFFEKDYELRVVANVSGQNEAVTFTITNSDTYYY